MKPSNSETAAKREVGAEPGAGAETVPGAGRALGYVLAVTQAVFYATMGIFGKLLYATGLNAQEVVILRFLATTVLLGAFMLVWRKQRLVSRQPVVYVQAIFFFLGAFLYFFAVERLTAGMTTVIFYMYPIVVAVLNMTFFRERLSVPTIVAFVLSVGGLILVSGIIGGVLVLDGLGIFYAGAACLSFAVYTILIQKTGRTEGPFTVTFTLSWTSLLASCIFFAPAVPTMLHLDWYQIGLGCVMALLNTILPIVLYIEAVKRIGGTKSSLIGISETPSSLILAFFLLGETLTFQQVAGTVLIVAGIVLVTVGPLLSKKGKVPADTETEAERT